MFRNTPSLYLLGSPQAVAVDRGTGFPRVRGNLVERDRGVSGLEVHHACSACCRFMRSVQGRRVVGFRNGPASKTGRAVGFLLICGRR